MRKVEIKRRSLNLTCWELEVVGVVEQVAAGARHTQQEGRHLTQQQRPPD